MPYRRPILATDLSDGAETAARMIPHLLAKDARGVLAHVIAPPELPPAMPAETLHGFERVVGERRHDTQRVLVDWAQGLGLPGWDATVEYGPVGATLARIVRERSADLLVVGSHGAGRIERALLGSTARSVLRHAPVDTLVARGPPAKLEHILLATDFQPPSRLAAQRAHAIAEQNRARVTLLHCIDPSLFAGVLYPRPPEGRFDAAWLKEHVLRGLSELNTEVFAGRATERAIHERASTGVLRQAGETDPDLIVIGSHGQSVMSRILLGSVAEAIASGAPGSVLVVRT